MYDTTLLYCKHCKQYDVLFVYECKTAAAAAANSIPVTGVTSSPAINVGAPGIPGRPDQFIKGPGMASLEALQR